MHLSFNPLNHPIMFTQPEWTIPDSAWVEHIPFGMFLVSALRPSVIVELGTRTGDSYCAFCQAVKELQLPTRCYAVDNRQSGEYAGTARDQAQIGLSSYHDPRYGDFSHLVRSTFDEALSHIPDHSVDLLHIDGMQRYEAVKHDFESWLPKVSTRGILIFHNTNTSEHDFGAHRFWAEVKQKYPSFEFPHGRGLGMVAVGEVSSPDLQAIFEAGAEQIIRLRDFFFRLGRSVKAEGRLNHLELELSGERRESSARQREIERLSQRVAATERLCQAAEVRRLSIESHAREYFNLTGSRAWKAMQLFWRVRRTFAPAGSLRARASKKLLHAVSRTAPKLRGGAPAAQSPSSSGSSPEAQPEPPTAGAQAAAWNCSDYTWWAERREPTEAELEAQHEAARLYDYRPRISIITPVYRTPLPVLRMAIESVLRQSYDHWELCLVEGNSAQEGLRQLLAEYASSDQRIRVKCLPENLGIAENTNEGLRMASGDFIALLDHDDELAPHALFEYVKRLNEDPATDIFYSDEDKLDLQGRRCHPFFKPDWSPDYFRGVMYVGHLLCFRRSLIKQAGWFDSRYDGVQDFEFMLRLSEATANIRHVPKVLYHWRQSPGSIAQNSQAKPKISELQCAAVNAHLARVGLPARAEIASPHHRLHISPLPPIQPEMVSIIIPSKDAPDYLEKCLATIYERSSYPNFEVVLVDNDTTDPRALAVMERFPIRRVPLPGKFNYSRANNVGVEHSRGTYLLFLNNDTEIVTPDWIEHLVYYGAQDDIGAASALLLFPDGTVQHAGVVLIPGGTAHHLMRDFPRGGDGYAGSLLCAHEVSAVTAACLLMKRVDFDAIGGFSEHYFTQYQDVDLCLRLRRMGKRIIYTSRAELIHYESKTRGAYYDVIDHALLLDQWQEMIERGDPYYNSNFEPGKNDYSLRG